MHFPSGHPWANLDPVVLRLISTASLPSTVYLSGTVVIQAKCADVRGAGTGFLVWVNSDSATNDPEFFLVTASHVVLDAAAFNLDLSALVVCDYDPKKPVQDRVAIPLDKGGWIHNENSDICVLPFPVDSLPLDHNLVAIPVTELASRKQSTIFHGGADLAAYGRWSIGGISDIAIRRSLTLATFEQPSPRLKINGAWQRIEVYLAEGTVSRGMSGGPVTYAGGGWGNSMVIGLIHGHAPLAAVDLPLSEGVEDAGALERLNERLGAINNQIVYVIPIHDIEPLLKQAGFPKP